MAQAAFDASVRSWLEGRAFPVSLGNATVTRFGDFAEVRVEASVIDMLTIQVRVEVSGAYLSFAALDGLWIVASRNRATFNNFRVHVNVPQGKFDREDDVRIEPSYGRYDTIRAVA